MRKSTKVKKTKVSKPVASTKKLKKFTNGGGNDIGTLKPKTPLEAAQSLKINPTIATAETIEQQKSSSENLMKGLMRPPAKEKETVVAAPKLESKTPVKSPKAKLLPGGFTSEAQRKAYTESLRQKIKSGKSVDQLVKEGYGTKKGLSDLGLGKYSEGLDLKKKGQAKKAEGLVSKSEGLRQKGIGMAVKGKGLRNKAIGKNEDLRPSKSKLTETEKNAIAKYKANPKNQKTLKLDPKKFSTDELAKSNYGNNIVGDFISGPVKAAATAVGVGAGLYGIYKGIKGVKSLKGAAAKLVKKSATEATETVAKSRKSSLKFNANRLQARSRVNRAQKEGLEGLTKTKDVVKNSATKTKDVVKNSATKTKDPIEGAKNLARNQRAKVDRIQKGGLEKLLKKSDKVVKSKKAPEPTVGGRTKSQVDAFEKRNKKAYDNDWAIIDSYRRGGKANTAKKTVAKVSVMRRGGKK